MRRERGFTLVELVIVMVVTGVLAVVAVPRLFDKSGFAARGARDFISSAVRYAQKSAVAMRRNVCISVGGSSLAATYASATGSGQICGAGNALANPANGLAYADPTNALPGGATVASPASLVFDATGRPMSAPATPLASALTISVNGYAIPVTIEPESGLVH